jgi:hypothetical protein
MIAYCLAFSVSSATTSMGRNYRPSSARAL